MTGFLSASLFFIAGCAALGIMPSSLLAAKARKPGLAVLTLVVAVFVIYVLVAAATTLPRS